MHTRCTVETPFFVTLVTMLGCCRKNEKIISDHVIVHHSVHRMSVDLHVAWHVYIYIYIHIYCVRE